ncbi:MBL fold metallo-hydrolase [Pararhodospirillum oryzae]|uniref:MBL fold metallo-hydrolase n=1 Tax=Pararhodospirillum oryzae TaxID=478448 RepID=A0A512H4W4_9PROT|nr:MBL fold metallo-hydrolase [Pararhodospirillum oryzae]GEO80477.1 MBL fold metallo-hydrolase [Pararhodospirillum oryzae]
MTTSCKIKFWGVRGSIACPSARHVIYGGNTSCVEVTLGDRHIILDAGTGIRNLGADPANRQVDHYTLLMTHTHWDHIFGFPFFGPAYNPKVKLDVYAGHLVGNGGIRHLLASQMSDPMFPVPLENLHSQKSFTDFQAGESFDLGDGIRVRTAPLNHPNGATGYRLEAGGYSLCYVTDTEHTPGRPDENILGLIDGADYVIYDSTYTEAEYPAHVGWGHSTWEEGVNLCQRARARHLVLFHHDPDHHDDFMSDLEKTAQNTWDGCLVARDGMELILPPR